MLPKVGLRIFPLVAFVVMSKCSVYNVTVLDNPSPFFSPFKFEITFEVYENLKEDLEWKLTYVGSAETEEYDQLLDVVLVGPVPEGRHMFVLETNPPDPTKIPPSEAVGVTVVLLTCSYRNQEFVKIGYFVSNDYTDPELKETPPEKPRFDLLTRHIIAEEPRVTKLQIQWDNIIGETSTLPVSEPVHQNGFGNTAGAPASSVPLMSRVQEATNQLTGLESPTSSLDIANS